MWNFLFYELVGELILKFRYLICRDGGFFEIGGVVKWVVKVVRSLVVSFVVYIKNEFVFFVLCSMFVLEKK